MSRVATTNLDLGTWTDGENPGAGSQSVDGTGLNGNFLKIDTALGTGHTTAGAHKAHVITGENLHAGVVDGATMDYDTSSHYLKVKSAGVTATQLATDAVETAKIKDANVTHAKLADDSVETHNIRDANVTVAKLVDTSITVAKLASGVPSKYLLWSEHRIADIHSSDAPSAESSWTEISASPIAKFKMYFVKKVTTKYLKFYYKAVVTTSGTPNGEKGYTQIVCGGLTGSKNSGGGTTNNEVCSLDVSSLTDETLYEIVINMYVDTGTTTFVLSQPILMATDA